MFVIVPWNVSSIKTLEIVSVVYIMMNDVIEQREIGYC